MLVFNTPLVSVIPALHVLHVTPPVAAVLQFVGDIEPITCATGGGHHEIFAPQSPESAKLVTRS